MQQRDCEVFGMLVRAARETRRFSKSQFAAALGQSIDWVREVEDGLTLPDQKTFEKMIVLLEVPRAYFEPVNVVESDHK